MTWVAAMATVEPAGPGKCGLWTVERISYPERIKFLEENCEKLSRFLVFASFDKWPWVKIIVIVTRYIVSSTHIQDLSLVFLCG